MNKEEFLQKLAESLNSNVGSKLTNELASGLYSTVNLMLNELKLGEKEDGKPADS